MCYVIYKIIYNYKPYLILKYYILILFLFKTNLHYAKKNYKIIIIIIEYLKNFEIIIIFAYLVKLRTYKNN